MNKLNSSPNVQAIKAAKSGNLTEALRLFKEAVNELPAEPKGYMNLGLIQKSLGNEEEAIANFQKAVDLTPRLSENENYYYNLAVLLTEQGKLEKAVEAYRKSVEIKPEFAKAHFALGVTYQTLERFEEAIASFEEAAAQMAKMTINTAHAHINKGVSLSLMEKHDRAAEALKEALKLKPDDVNALLTCGIISRKEKNLEEALKYLHRANAIQPNNPSVLSYLNMVKLEMCDWTGIFAIQKRLRRCLESEIGGKKVSEPPFFNITWCDDKKLNLRVASNWCEEVKRKYKTDIRFLHSKRKAGAKIRLGYLSHDFYSHAVAHLCVNLFETHDKNEFEVYAYSYGHDDGSWYRKKMMSDADKFFDIKDMSFIDAAKKIYDDKIDILIDLASHAEGRIEICTLHPAPIQLTWIGFPGESGADFFDYMLADKVIIPLEDRKYYAEKIIYMPDTHQINNNKQVVSPKKFSRHDFELPEKSFVYCCFNGTYKIEPKVFSSWMRILKKIKGSVLWLVDSDLVTTANLRKEAVKRGVNPKRLIFTPIISESENLARHRLADLYLNTRIFNGYTTMADALYMGLPVITLLGKHFTSRQASGLLTAIGMPELITHSPKEYEALAIELGTNPKKYKKIKAKLIANKKTYPLFDTPRFVKNLETAYQKIWKLYLKGKKPEDIIL